MITTPGGSMTVTADRPARRAPDIIVGLIALGMLPVGAQAAFFPRSFYDDFPLGRGWINADGAYNEHVVRDVGALFCALVIATIVVLVRRASVVPVAGAWLVQGLLHFWYHAGHLDAYDGADRLGLIASLVFVPILAAVALVLELFGDQGAAMRSNNSS
jgi:hypothetical protein